MLVKGIVDEDFINYKLPSMFIGCHSCTFKCGSDICQNSELVSQPDINVSNLTLVQRYLDNPITEAVVFGGLEPFDDADNVIQFIQLLRGYGNNDDVVIYTGYTEEEVSEVVENLRQYENIIVKFGRFVPNQESHFDNVLGVKLSSNNQYARKLK